MIVSGVGHTGAEKPAKLVDSKPGQTGKGCLPKTERRAITKPDTNAAKQRTSSPPPFSANLEGILTERYTKSNLRGNPRTAGGGDRIGVFEKGSGV
ncbi:hypothetical protein AUK22_02265 [bacterium CG2_30_54_10]|nr:MAG: hypothetical protein AUK22_02265 [bacterium CG2_30_54_10]